MHSAVDHCSLTEDGYPDTAIDLGLDQLGARRWGSHLAPPLRRHHCPALPTAFRPAPDQGLTTAFVL